MRITLRRIFLLIPAFLVAACGEQPSAPAPSVAVAEDPFLDVFATYASDMKSADIIVEPSGGVFVLGKHAIRFPEGSICDPAVSSYGPTEWDAPCTPISEPIHIHAELRDQDGRTWIDFTPALRFVPTDDPNQWVYLFMETTEAEGQALTGESAPPMFWSYAIGIPGVDESLLDPTLKTRWEERLGGVYRRIKHFTGYNVFSGRE